MKPMTSEPRVKSLASLLAVTGCAGIMTSCSPPLNGTDGLLGENPLPAVSSDAVGTERAVSTQALGEVVPFDRSTWSTHTIVIDPSQVQHHPSYGSSQTFWNTSHSVDGQPTIATVFKTGNARSDELMNGLLAPLGAGIDLVLLPIRMIVTPPWSIMTSPRELEIMPPSDDATHDVRSTWLDSDSTDGKQRP